MNAVHGMTKEKWIEVFAEAGLDEAARHAWHVAFEHREPEGHRSFLAWLGLSADEIERIRRDARS